MQRRRYLGGYLAVISLLALGAGAVSAKLIPGDARRGSEIFRSLGCISCHRLGGEGGVVGPDLTKGIGRGYTPSSMASTMWNHAPQMWANMEKRGVTRPALTEAQAGDLFAYFHSVRFFDRPGDAARGKSVFASSGCAQCHGLSTPLPGGAPAVASWGSLSSSIVFAQQMWNHAPQMEVAMANRKIKWVHLTSQELTDLLVYVRNLPETRGRITEFSLTPTGQGEALFEEKGCRNCHQGKLALENRLVTGTVTDFAVAMWNHAPAMAAYGRSHGQVVPRLEAQEMQDIVSYLWYAMLFAEPGDQDRGRRVFEKKHCSTCHDSGTGGAPNLKQSMSGRSDPVRPFTLMSVLWQHGPVMLERMKSMQLEWPAFSKGEMVDLIAYLNSMTPGQDKGR